ncbi:hypothetical protein ACFQZ2_16240, partial [Streptomonospora algeriensis]
MLTDALAGARAGQGAALLVCGGPGIGKTALLNHACEVARTPHVRHSHPPQEAMVLKGAMVLSSAGAESESAMPFAGLQRLLRPVADRLGE